MDLAFKRYPFIKCLHPQSIINPYTGQPMVVSCGHCKACNLRKAAKMTFLCSKQESISKYTYFITLTYSNDYVPKFKCNYNHDTHMWDFVSVCKRFNDYEATPLIGSLPYSDYPSYKMDMIYKKTNLNGFIPFAYFRDVQLFIKRVRKAFSKYEKEEKIKFYVVSEYGPKTFRPHFHVCIYNESDRIHAHWQKVISKAWQYGRVNSSLSRGKTSSYVASYVNSSCSLPAIYGVGSIKPKGTHSRFFGTGFSKQEYEQFYQMPINEVAFTRSTINGKIVRSPLPSSLQTTLFPRCKGYFGKSFIERYISYTIVARFKRYKYTANYLGAEKIALDILQCHSNPITDYFVSSVKLNKYPEKDFISDFMVTKDYELLVNSIYREILLSLHFIRDICHYDSNLYLKRVKHIHDFYNFKDSVALHDFYDLQSEYMANSLYPFSVCHFYDNFFEYRLEQGVLHKELSRHALKLYADLGGLEIEGTFDDKIDLTFNPLYKDFKFYVDETTSNKIKHKILNDLNNIFL